MFNKAVKHGMVAAIFSCLFITVVYFVYGKLVDGALPLVLIAWCSVTGFSMLVQGFAHFGFLFLSNLINNESEEKISNTTNSKTPIETEYGGQEFADYPYNDF